MKDSRIRKSVLCAMFAAMICVATMVIRIPSVIGGYVNCGDIFVILCACLAGPLYGGIAAGLGSALADILAGYVSYAPGTAVIKAAMAVACALILRKKSKPVLFCTVGGVCAELIMIGGYFVYSAFILALGIGAAAEIPGNAVQGAVGIIGSTLLYGMVRRNRELHRFLSFD